MLNSGIESCCDKHNYVGQKPLEMVLGNYMEELEAVHY